MPEVKNPYVTTGNMAQRLVISTIAIFCALFIFFLSVFGVSGGAYAAAETGAADESGIMKELSGLTIDGKPFSSEDYPADENGTPYVLMVYEVGYGYYANKRAAYGLILYVYNPAQLNVQEDSRNTVQLKAGNAARYDKYGISIASASADKLFYKFEVAFTEQEKTAVLSALDKDSRVYEISSIELYTEGYNATDYALPNTQIFTFTGYAAGLGQTSGDESTLASTLSYTIAGGTETVPLSVYHTSWRPEGTNGNSNYTQDVIHSVYFAVPNKYAEQYDYLNSVKARWIEARTAPILVTGNRDVIRAIQKLQMNQEQEAELFGTGLPDKFDFTDFNWLISSPSVRTGNVIEGIKETIEVFFGNDDWYKQFTKNYIEGGHLVEQEINKRINALYLLGYVENGAGVLTSSEVETAIKEATANFREFNDCKVAGKYPSFLFESWDKDFHTEVIEVGDKRTLNSEEVKQFWWEKLFNTSHVENVKPYKNIDAILQVTDSLVYGGSEEEICNRLYISERDYKDFTAFYDKAQKEDSTVYLLRFAVSEYWRAAVTESQENGWGIAVVKSNGYFAQSNCYLDFDIIDLEYKKDDKRIVLPVKMSPIDIFTELTPPPFEEPSDFWKYAVGTMAGLTVLYVVYKSVCRRTGI